MENLTCKGLSAAHRRILIKCITEEIGSIPEPVEIEFMEPIRRKQYSSLWYGGQIAAIRVHGCVFEVHKARRFVIETPLGKLEVYAKHDKSDCAADYPGVFIDFVREDGATVVLACVEYDPDKDLLQTVVYGDCASDEPTAIAEHYNTDFED